MTERRRERKREGVWKRRGRRGRRGEEENDEEKYEVGEKRKWEGYKVTQFNDIIFGGAIITIPA